MRCTLAYLAGIIDADGTIGVKRSTYAMRVRGDAGAPIYSERIAVRQVEPAAVDLLAATFGGSRYMTRPSSKNGRPLYTWSITDAKAAACLTAIRPFLRIKAAQADNALRLRPIKSASKKARTAVGRGHAGGSARPDTLSDEMETVYVEAKRLNHVGI